MVDRPRPRRLLVLLVPTLAILGCSGVEPIPPPGSAPVPAEVLADHAERLADHLRVDNGCRTLAEAEALLERAADGVTAGEVPREVAIEIRHVVAEVTADISCGAEPTPLHEEQTEAADEPPVDREDGSEASGTAAQGSPPQEQTAPSPAPAPAATHTVGQGEAEKGATGKGRSGAAPGRSKQPAERNRGGGR